MIQSVRQFLIKPTAFITEKKSSETDTDGDKKYQRPDPAM